jgi:hypothetical protein
MYILCLFEAVYISHDLSLEKKGLECTPDGVGPEPEFVNLLRRLGIDWRNVTNSGSGY